MSVYNASLHIVHMLQLNIMALSNK